MNKFAAFILICLCTLSLVSCGDDNDEPINGDPVEDIYFPNLPAGHKSISRIEKTFKNGTVATADAKYDNAGHLTEVSMEMPYSGGTTTESVVFYYNKGVIRHILGWQTTDYVFKTDRNGHITSIANSQGKSIATLQYDAAKLVSLSTVSSSTNYSTAFNWKDNDNIHAIVTKNSNNIDSTAMVYTTSYPNTFSIDIMGLGQSPFGNLIELVLKSEGLFGEVSAELPRALYRGNNSYIDDSGHIKMLHCILDYQFNQDGSVKTMNFTVPRSDDNEQISNIESYSLAIYY